MIRAIGPEDEASSPALAPLLAQAFQTKALGVCLQVDWLLKQENPSLPYHFYWAGEHTLLEDTGRTVTIIGPVANTPELQSFLSFIQAQRVLSTQPVPTLPEAWHATPLQVMQWESALPQTAPPLPQGAQLDKAPRPAEMLHVLESDQPMPAAARDNFYADLCLRQNHGYSAWVGARLQGRLASIAGASRLTAAQAYISGVQTCPAHRKQGLAAHLVSHLCHQLSGRQIHLLCRPQLAAFYHRLGFATQQQPVFSSSKN